MADSNDLGLSRRHFVQGTVAGAVLAAAPAALAAAPGKNSDKAAVLAQDPENARGERQASAGLDRAALDCRGEPQLPARRRVHGETRRARPDSPA